MANFNWTVNPSSTTTQSTGALGEAEGEFGKDIYFDGDYHLTSSGDYTTIQGAENLRKAIFRRLMTRPGEYKLRPTYGVGMPTFVKKKKTPALKGEVKRAIIDNLTFEDRIDRIEEVFVDDIDGGLQVSLTVTATGKRLRFRPFEFTEIPSGG